MYVWWVWWVWWVHFNSCRKIKNIFKYIVYGVGEYPSPITHHKLVTYITTYL